MSNDVRDESIHVVLGATYDVAGHGGVLVRVAVEPVGADGRHGAPFEVAFGLADWALLRDAWRQGVWVCLTPAFAHAFRWPR